MDRMAQHGERRPMQDYLEHNQDSRLSRLTNSPINQYQSYPGVPRQSNETSMVLPGGSQTKKRLTSSRDLTALSNAAPSQTLKHHGNRHPMQDYLEHNQDSQLVQYLAQNSRLSKSPLNQYQSYPGVTRRSNGTSMIMTGGTVTRASLTSSRDLAALSSTASSRTGNDYITTSMGERALSWQRCLEPPTEGATLEVRPLNSLTLLECPFNVIHHCLLSFLDLQEWIEHSLTHFRSVEPPKENRCCFSYTCTAQFQEQTGNESWRERMIHVYSHHQNGSRLTSAQPDFKLIDYMWRNRLITEVDYRELRANYAQRAAAAQVYPLAKHRTSSRNYTPLKRAITQSAADLNCHTKTTPVRSITLPISSSSLRQRALKEFVAAFVKLLVRNPVVRASPIIIRNTNSRTHLEGLLPKIFKEYLLELSRMASPGSEAKATRTVRRCQGNIVQCFIESCADPAAPSNFDDSHLLRKYRALFSMPEKIGKWHDASTKDEPEGPYVGAHTEDIDGETDPDTPVDFEAVRAFLTTGLPFKRLISRIAQLQDDKYAKMASIKAQVVDALTGTNSITAERHYAARLFIDWGLIKFLDGQFFDGCSKVLASVITLSGSAMYAQAATCAEYVRHNWPSRGLAILELIQAAIVEPDHTSRAQLCDFEIYINIKEPAEVEMRGSVLAIAEVTQQLAWIGAAFQVSDDGQVQYSEANMHQVSDTEGVVTAAFRITFGTVSLLQAEQSCWHPLFFNPVIARGFPIPERDNNEIGVEIPLEIMAALGGARHAIDFEGGLVLKGHSTMLVPTKHHKGSIQWHLLSNTDGTRLPYREVRTQCATRALLDEVDHESLQNTRAFLGWWRAAETHLGTADVAYDNIDWSPAPEIGRSATFTGGTFGFSKIVTGGLNFAVGPKDGKLFLSRKGPFETIIQCAEKTPVVLYDPGERRGWLVPALDVMLHIVHTRHNLTPYTTDGVKVCIEPADPKLNGFAAQKATIDNAALKLFGTDLPADKGYYFKDLILDIWSFLERLMEKNAGMEASPGVSVHGTMRASLCGWEYMSLVEERNFRQKEKTIEKTNGGWTDLVHDIDAVVLFASGFQDIIKPAHGLYGLCPRWRSLPKHKDYLAAGVPIINMLFKDAGSRLTHQHLSSTHLQWHRGQTLFEQCTGATNKCDCDRLQQIFHESVKTIGKIVPPGKLEEHGCIIFGQAHHPFRSINVVQKRRNKVHILDNTSILTVASSEASLPVDQRNISSLCSPPSGTTMLVSDTVSSKSDVGHERRSSLPVKIPSNVFKKQRKAPKDKRGISNDQGPSLARQQSAEERDITHQKQFPSDHDYCPRKRVLRTIHDTFVTDEASESSHRSGEAEAKCHPIQASIPLRPSGKSKHCQLQGCNCKICSVKNVLPVENYEIAKTTSGAHRIR